MTTRTTRRREGSRQKPPPSRGLDTMKRLAHALAMREGVPEARALQIVRSLFAAIREDLQTADRFVIPGVLIVERTAQGASRPHSVRFVLHTRQKAAERIARLRSKSGP